MVRLRAEEEFDVARAIAGTTRKHFVGYAMEVVSIDDRVADDVVGFEKRAQVREVEELRCIFIIVRRQTVLPRQLDCRGCGDRSFEMQVQLGFGQRPEQSSRYSRLILLLQPCDPTCRHELGPMTFDSYVDRKSGWSQ